MSKKAKSGSNSKVRIIGGRWRSRKIEFESEGIRPTGDRVRETLFNWLAGRLAGACCLDMFAGSGALGFEALSRGAERVVFVEHNSTAVRFLKMNRDRLHAAAEIVCADARSQPFRDSGPFDIVFIDPPFDSVITDNLCKLLDTSNCLAVDAVVYVEKASSSASSELPAGWRVLREGTAGQVSYALLSTGGRTEECE